MNAKNIIRKLTSRKFWLAVIGFVTPLMITFGYDESAVTQASAIIMAGGTLIAYIIGEGLVDASSTESGTAKTEEKTEDAIFSIIHPDDREEE